MLLLPTTQLTEHVHALTYSRKLTSCTALKSHVAVFVVQQQLREARERKVTLQPKQIESLLFQLFEDRVSASNTHSLHSMSRTSAA